MRMRTPTYRWAVAGLGLGALLLAAGLRPARPVGAAQAQEARQGEGSKLERGRYLVESVATCKLCHSEIDWSKDLAPPLPGRAMSGVTPFPESTLAWLHSPNITPHDKTGIGRWSDDEIAGAIRNGVRPDGRVLFPFMPYLDYHKLSDADLAAMIAYLRSMKPVDEAIPVNVLPPDVQESLHALPAVQVAEPKRSDPVAYGAYLTHVATCTHCHTPIDPAGRPLPGLDWAGGFVARGPWGTVCTANLTPDASGISYYDEELFLKVMRTGYVGARKLNNLMPWHIFKDMTDADLKAIFAYLQTLPPVQHRVDNVSPPTPCTRCGAVHGLGDSNG